MGGWGVGEGLYEGRAKDGKEEERAEEKKQSPRKCDFQSVRDSKKTLSDDD